MICASLAACGGGGATSGGIGAAGSAGTQATTGSGGAAGASGSTGAGASGSTSRGGADGATGQAGAVGSTPPPPAPKTICDLPAMPTDTSKPTTVVGDGQSAASCTEAALRAAVAAGGVVTFACGAAPATITVTSELPVGKDTTIDGGGTVTLSGGGKSRILHITSAWNVPTPLLTVQNLTFTGGFTSDVKNTMSTKMASTRRQPIRRRRRTP